LRYRAINQAARELLLAEASDWPFIMKAGTMVAYAKKRLKVHLNRFYKLHHDLENDTIDDTWLKEIESRDNIFWDTNCVKHYLEKQKPLPLAPLHRMKKPITKYRRGPVQRTRMAGHAVSGGKL
jgi:hypothetical protein